MGQKIKDEDLHAVHDSEVLGDPSKYSKSDSRDEIIEKKFLERNSLLTEMSQLDHMLVVNKIIMVFLFAFILKESTLHFLGVQKFDLALDLILWNFGGIGTTIVYWLVMFSSSVSYYYGFYFWAMERRKMFKLGKNRTIIEKWDFYCLIFMISYMITFLTVPCILLLRRKLPHVSVIIILFEQVRLMMKKYAYSRSNIPKLMEKCEDENFQKHLPGLSKYIYFLFAPTLIYSNHYPRRSNINWKKVIWHFINFAAMLIYWAIIFKHCIIPRYQEFTKEKLTWKILTTDVINTTIPLLTIHMASFYLLLHSWMNAFAEMMQFSDRMFYKDWWNCSNFARFFRTWNVLVGDWLYIYIYKDIAYLTAVKDQDTGIYKTRPIIPRLAVFIISALFHEYILATTFKFLYPIQFIMFAVVGGLAASILKTKGDICNILMIFSLGFGNALMLALYCNEWFARKICPMQLDPYLDFITPRSWYC